MPQAAALLLAACPLLAALTGCSTVPVRETSVANGAQTTQLLSVRGILVDNGGGIALPRDGFAIIELRDTGPPRAVVAEQRIELAGRSLPLPFELVVRRANLVGSRTYAVRGAVKPDARVQWATDPVVIDTTSTSAIDLGQQDLKPVIVAAFASNWNCGGQHIVIGMAGDLLRVILGDSYIDMHPVIAASSMKYEAVGDPTTTLWSQERRATLTVRGKEWPECVWVSNSE